MNEQRFIDGGLRPLIRFFEQIYLQNVVMKRILDEIPGLDWKKRLLEGLPELENEREATEKFGSLYQSLDDNAAFHEAIQAFLGIKRSC